MTKSAPGTQGKKPMGMRTWYKVTLIILASSEMSQTIPSYLTFRVTKKNSERKIIIKSIHLYGGVLILMRNLAAVAENSINLAE